MKERCSDRMRRSAMEASRKKGFNPEKAPHAMLAAGAMFTMLGAGMAQSATAADTAAIQYVDEIVVTARKRTEELIDVPGAVSVVDADVFERNNAGSLADISVLVPGLQITSDSAQRAFVSIRGVGNTEATAIQPGVGVFIDGVYQPDTAYFASPLVDIERIEVLRGPQGTLYGKNTLGGAINVVTRQPGDVLEGRVFADYTWGDKGYSAGASISGPLVEGRLQGRVGASTKRADGFFTNKLIGGDAYPVEVDTFNAGLRWQASDEATLSINASYMDFLGGDVNYAAVDGPRDYRDNIELNILNRARFEYVNLNARLELGLPALNTQLTVIGAYNNRDREIHEDGDFTSLDLVRTDNVQEHDLYTVEVRLDTRFSDAVSTLFGVFGSRREVDGFTDTMVPIDLVQRMGVSSVEESYSVFATLFWNPRPDLELTLGLRYDHESIENESHLLFPAFPGGVVTSFEGDEIDPKISLTKLWTPEFMTYASIARGHRGGGANSVDAPPGFETYEGDYVWSYEVGTKARVADRRVSLAASAFYNDYRDYLDTGVLVRAPAGNLVAVIANVGDVETYGLEVEASAQLTPRWTLSGALSLQEAKIVDVIEATGAISPSITTGRVSNQPKWKFSLDSAYRLPLGSGDMTFRASVTGTGDRGGTASDGFSPVLGEYFLVNAAVAYRHGPVELSVFGNNLFDEKYWNFYIDGRELAALGLPFTNLGLLGAERNVGIRVKYEF